MTAHLLYPRRRPLLLAVAGFAAVSLAFGQTVAQPSAPAPVSEPAKPAATETPVAPAETVKLSTFTVSTERDRGYYTANSTAGNVLADKPIKELAMAVTVVNRDLLDDLQTMNITEALTYSAAYSPEGGTFRGQPSGVDPASGQFTNRVGNSTNGVPESGAVERMELIKGPPSVLMSSASAGGSINITPKRPKGFNYTETEYQFGNYQNRYRVELNRVITSKFSTLFGVQLTKADFNGNSLPQTNIPEFDFDRRFLVFNSTTWKPFRDTELGVDIEQLHDRSNRGNATALRFATVTQNGQSVRLPWYLAYNMPLNYSITGPDILTGKDHRYVTGRWIQKWATHFRTEANIYNQWYNEKTFAGNQIINDSNTVAGLGGKRAVQVGSYDRTQTAQRTTQIAFRGLFDYAIKDTKHQLILKYNYYTFYTDANSYRAYLPGTNPVTGLTTANELKGAWRQVEDVTVDQLNSYDRSYPDDSNYLWRYTQDVHDNPHRHQGNIIYTGEYPTRIGTFFPLAGISYHSQIESFQSKFANVGGAITNLTRQFSRPKRWGSAPSAGVVYQINPSVGFYASYLESFQVPAVFNSFNELMPNREGVSFEAGVKIDLFDRKVTGTFSHFDTTDKNKTLTDPTSYNINTRDINGLGPRDPGFDETKLAPNTSRGDTVAVGEYNAKGWDMEVTLQPVTGFQATLSATFIDAGVTADLNPSIIGSQAGGTAKRNYAAVVNYRFMRGKLKGLSIGTGYRYTSARYLSRQRQSSTFGSPFVDLWQPSTESMLVFAKYTFKIAKKDAWVQVNIDNLTNTKRYINEQSFTNLVIYGIDTPTVWKVTTGVRF